MKSIVFFLILMTINSAYGFKLSPMTQTLFPEEKQNHLIYRVQNNSNEPIAVQLSLAKRVMDKFGKEKHPEVEDDFIVFPDQLILQPKQKRSIKVTYLGKKKLQSEKAYRLIAEQLPIDVAKQKKGVRTNIKILLKYIAALYVAPVKAVPQVQLLTKISAVKKNKFKVVVKNSGTLHKILNTHVLALKSGAKKYQMNAKEMEGMFGENLLAGNEREFHLKLPKRMAGLKEVNLEFKKISD